MNLSTINNVNRKYDKLIVFLTIILVTIPIINIPENFANIGTSTTPKSDQLSIKSINQALVDTINISELSFFDDNYDAIVEIDVQNNYAYIVLQSEGFIIVNITDASKPNVVTFIKGYLCNTVDIQDDYLYVTNTTHLLIFDVSNIFNPFLIGNFTTSFTVNNLIVKNNIAYMTDFLTFYTINITNPTNPTLLDSIVYFLPVTMCLANNYVYINNNIFNTLNVYNVTDPTNIVSVYSTSISVINDMYAQDDYLYITFGTEMEIWNFTDHTLPILAYEYATPINACNEVGVKGNYLYLQIIPFSILVLDISNKSQPEFTSQIRTEIIFASLEIFNNHLFITDAISLGIIDTSNPLDLELLYFDQYAASSFDIFISGDYAYIVEQSNLEILDISNPNNPKEIGQFYDGLAISHVFVTNGLAYLLEPGFGLKIVDVSNPSQPLELGNISLAGVMSDIYVTGDFAYIAFENSGIAIVDIYFPDAPQLALIYDEFTPVNKLEMKDDILYLTTPDTLFLVKMDNPYYPTILGNWTRGSSIHDVFISGSKAYLVCDEGFEIIDVSNTLLPEKVGQFFGLPDPKTLYFEYQYVYLLDESNGLSVYDTSMVTHPKRIGTYNDLGVHHDLWVKNGHIYLAEDINGTRILITEPLLTLKTPSYNPLTFLIAFVFLSSLAIFFKKRKKLV